jgi:hypothetical protein
MSKPRCSCFWQFRNSPSGSGVAAVTIRAHKLLSVGVVLLDLVLAGRHQPDLFVVDDQGRQKNFRH